MSGPEMSDLALATADELAKKPGVSGVVVFVLHHDEAGTATGSAYNAPNLPFDFVMGEVIEAIAMLRQRGKEVAMAESSAAPAQSEGSSN